MIMIAEDDAGHYLLIQRNLQRIGLKNEILRLHDGQELLEYIDALKKEQKLKSRPYVLFLDLRMPKVDGVQILEKLKKDPSLCKIPVIIITTAQEPDVIERCHRLGCCLYLVKPVDYERFVELIQKIGNFLSIVELPYPAAG